MFVERLRTIAFFGLWVCLIYSAASVAANAENFVVRGAKVFDGRRFMTDADVWVESGKIKAFEVPAGVNVVNGMGATLLPGLIDAHTHAWGDALREAIIFGVTTELDMFTDVRFMQEAMRREAEGKNGEMASLLSAGTLATVRGGHGTQYGFAIPTLSSPDEAAGWVKARIDEGSDFIKIVYDDGSQYGFKRPTLSKETMKSLIDAAHEQGKLAIVHIGSQQQARDALEAGADGLAHLFADSAPASDFAPFVAKHQAFVVSTLSVLESVSGRPSGKSLETDPRLEPYLSSANITSLNTGFPPFSVPLSVTHAQQAARELQAAGVPILAGSDAPNPGTAHGASIHRELELLVDAGLSPAEALAAATSAPATAFRLEDRGQIAPGKRADLVLVKGDPAQNITATRAIVAVWQAGEPVDRESYRKRIEAQKQEAEAAKVAAVAKEPDLGPISNFEDNKPSAKFGFGWTISTDSILGGKSVAEMKPADGGANAANIHSM